MLQAKFVKNLVSQFDVITRKVCSYKCYHTWDLQSGAYVSVLAGGGGGGGAVISKLDRLTDQSMIHKYSRNSLISIILFTNKLELK